jgi:hypothetical protein
MKLSPAPTSPQRPDSAACSSARGAGVQFATSPNGERYRGSGRAKGGLVAFNQWESLAQDKTGPESNTTAPKRAAETIRATRMREGSICPVLPPNFPPPQSWEVAGLSAGTGYSA